MKQAILIVILFLSNPLFSQVISGSVVQARRVRTDSTSLVIYDKHEGVVIIEVAVDRTGKVTGSRIHGEGTTIDSQQSLIKAAVLAKQLTFTAGTHYDKFQHALVKFTFVKEDEEWIEEGE